MVVTEHKNPQLTIQEVAVAVQVLLALTLRLQVVLVVQAHLLLYLLQHMQEVAEEADMMFLLRPVLVVQVAVVLEEVVQDLIQEHQELLILEAVVAALVVDQVMQVLLVVQV